MKYDRSEREQRPRYPVERRGLRADDFRLPGPADPMPGNPFGTAFSANAAGHRDFDKSAQK